jgi:hypothetical protein
MLLRTLYKIRKNKRSRNGSDMLNVLFTILGKINTCVCCFVGTNFDYLVVFMHFLRNAERLRCYEIYGLSDTKEFVSGNEKINS